MKKQILIVIPHYGSDEHLARLLPSLGVAMPPREMLATRQIVTPFNYGEICIINNNIGNNGFTKGCNEGIRYGLGKGFDAVWLLNNDTKVPSVHHAVSSFWEEFQEYPKTGVIGCKSLLMSDPDFIHHAGTGSPYPFGVHKQGYVSRGDFDKRSVEKWVTGASFVISALCLQEIGLLDERFYNCASDSDYCYRARYAGFEVVYLPVPILHGVGGGTDAPKPQAAEIVHDDAEQFAKKWITGKVFAELDFESLPQHR